jgi:hypothetical protein
MSTKNLAQQWQSFEQKHGAIKNWRGAPGVKINFWPKYVNCKHTVSGRKSSSALVTVHMVPEGKEWRVDEFSIGP